MNNAGQVHQVLVYQLISMITLAVDIDGTVSGFQVFGHKKNWTVQMLKLMVMLDL